MACRFIEADDELIGINWQFWKILKTLVQLILNSTWPHVITYTKRWSFSCV